MEGASTFTGCVEGALIEGKVRNTGETKQGIRRRLDQEHRGGDRRALKIRRTSSSGTRKKTIKFDATPYF